MKITAILTILSTILSFHARSGVIYGPDGRKEIFESSEAIQNFARSTPTMILATELSAQSTGLALLNQASLQDLLQAEKDKDEKFQSYCSDERFIHQPSPGMCSTTRSAGMRSPPPARTPVSGTRNTRPS